MTILVQRFFRAVAEGRLISAITRRLIPTTGKPNEFDDFLKKCRGVVHVGAHDGGERHVYAKYGLKVVWIEPIPEVYRQLVENIREFPDQIAINSLITNEDDTIYALHISSNSGQSSSI